MITINDYLYSGDTVLKILHNYYRDLKEDAIKNKNTIDLAHCNFLIQLIELLEHNDFLTSQSQRIREFYKYMSERYPNLAFTFKGRIKSLIRAEEKFNGYILEYIYNNYCEKGEFPSEVDIKNRLSLLSDMIAYRIIISMPICHLPEGADRNQMELEYLYDIANHLPAFLEERGFNPKVTHSKALNNNGRLNEDVKPYYKDYIITPNGNGYQSLHITFFDSISRNYLEVQLRTKQMDDLAEIGDANHTNYEKMQHMERARRDAIEVGANTYFDDAYERVQKIRELDLSKIDVNMFAAVNNSLINDGCGLFRGRLILPYEHLSRFQNDLID